MGLFSGTCADGALHPSPLRRYQSAGASWGHRRRHYLGDVHDHQPGGQQVRDSRCLIRSHLASSSYSDRRPSFSNFVSPRLMPTCAQIAPRGASPVCAQYRRPAWDHSSSHRNRGGGGGGDAHATQPPTAGEGLCYRLKQPFQWSSDATLDCVFGDNISVHWDGLERCQVALIDIDLVFRSAEGDILGYTSAPSGNPIPLPFAVWISTKLSLEGETAGKIRTV